MAQVKIYGLRSHLETKRASISGAVHAAIVEALHYPKEKKFHRFFPFEPEDFSYPEDRSEQYTIIEISIFEGRSVETGKQLIRLLFKNLEDQVGIAGQDVEITIFETPKENWGIRGVPGDELSLNYRVEV